MSREECLLKWATDAKNTELYDGVVAAVLFAQFRKSRNTLIYVKAVQLWNKFVSTRR